MKKLFAILVILPVTLNADVTMLWPTNGAVVSGVVQLQASAPKGTRKVEFYRGGVLIGTCVKLFPPSNLRIE